ncbi:hypothetical protein KIPB_006090 [Kipferlia bialata]|uniref:Uncharacterized protein n=1 Tax=Kipferlia bialata TaxID=797122 RepID=A0A9K3CWP8_9EUKA|nr:hypothetical protein KIPB_006090 [Kipferlia bialata]|eukprot:g6090.t1
MGLWRELAKRGVTARVYMCLDEDQVYDDEAGARALYTDLVDTVQAQYVNKLSEDIRRELWERADTLQCLPLNRYFEDVWCDVCYRRRVDK